MTNRGGLTTHGVREEGATTRRSFQAAWVLNEGVKRNGLRYADRLCDPWQGASDTWLDDCHSEGVITSKTRPAQGLMNHGGNPH